MPEDRDRALALLRRHGWNTTSFQLLESGTRYFFDPVVDAFVGYVDTGSAWVAGGAPVAAEEHLAGVAARFVAEARRRGRRVVFFAAAERFARVAQGRSILVGEQPTWDPRRWPDTLAASSSLRAQVRRAGGKGVTVRVVSPDELAPSGPLRAQLDRIVAAWLRQKPMAPMGFLVDVQPFHFPEERIHVVAEREGHVIAFLAAVPAYARDAWLFEDLLRVHGTPNGTTEALIDAAMRAAAARGARLVTLGLAPLSGDVPGGLAWARQLAGPLYDFAGVRAFKARLHPDAWEPVYLVAPDGSWTWLAVVDALGAFANGSFVAFGLRTIARGPPFVVWGLITALVAWIPVLAGVDPTRWFPAAWVQSAWVGFDVVLCVLLVSLARRYRTWLATLALLLVSLDATLTLAEALTWNLPRIDGAGALVGVVVACCGPVLGALALRGMIEGRVAMAGPAPASE